MIKASALKYASAYTKEYGVKVDAKRNLGYLSTVYVLFLHGGKPGKPTGAFSRSVTFWVCFAGLGGGGESTQESKSNVDKKQSFFMKKNGRSVFGFPLYVLLLDDWYISCFTRQKVSKLFYIRNTRQVFLSLPKAVEKKV